MIFPQAPVQEQRAEIKKKEKKKKKNKKRSEVVSDLGAHFQGDQAVGGAKQVAQVTPPGPKCIQSLRDET